MFHDEMLEVGAAEWSKLSKGKKWKYVLAVLAIAGAGLGGAFALGQWFKTAYYEQKIASIQAQDDRKIVELERTITQLQQKAVAAQPFSLRFSEFHVGEDNVPELSLAEKSDLTMSEVNTLELQQRAEFEAAYASFVAKTKELTSLQRPAFQGHADKCANKAYKWTGYVSDVAKDGDADKPVYCVEMRLSPEKNKGLAVTCVFEGAVHDEMMKQLARDQRITVRGVRAHSGRLLHCLLVESFPKQEMALAH